jgi:uncharacterized protein YndB with AHSA1/START domain
MTSTQSETLQESIHIAAGPEKVWALVGDPAHYPRWSPMTAKTFVRGRPVSAGSALFSINRKGFLVWPTRARVTAYEAGRRIAFRITENWTTWSYEVEPDGDGTTLTLRRDAAEGIAPLSTRLQRSVLGGEEPFTRELREGIHASLVRIKADAEA